MRGFYHHSHTKRVEGVLNAVTYLHGKPLLDLKAACIGLHHPGNLAQAGNLSVRDVCDMGLPDEWHDMMFAGRVQFDVLHENHLAVVFVEHCAAKYLGSVLMLAMSKELQGLRYPLRGFDKTFTLRIFAKKAQDFLIMFSYLSGNVLAVDFILYVCHFVINFLQI